MSEALFTNLDSSSKFEIEFKKNLKLTNNLTIASGYFGASTILDFEDDLVDISRKGQCKILLGMIFHQGVTKKQNEALIRVNEKIRSVNEDSGIFISTTPYHGKIYNFNFHEGDSNLYLGSSNFSQDGFASRNECTALISDHNIKQKVENYLTNLFSTKLCLRLEEVELRSATKSKTKKPSKLLEDYQIQAVDFPDITEAQGVCPIKLRVDSQPESGLNLYFGAGRRNQNGKFEPRPWYEIEIGAQRKDYENPYYPESKPNPRPNSPRSRSRLGAFTAFAEDDGKFYKFNMKVSADNGKNIASAEESGGRATLGKFIKGKLEKAGLLQEGELITSEMLYEFGNDTIELHKLDSNRYIIKFDGRD